MTAYGPGPLVGLRTLLDGIGRPGRVRLSRLDAHEPGALDVARARRGFEAPEERVGASDHVGDRADHVVTLTLPKWIGRETAPVTRAPEAFVVRDLASLERNGRSGDIAAELDRACHPKIPRVREARDEMAAGPT